MKTRRLKLLLFVLFLGLAVGMSYSPLRALFQHTQQPESYSHIPAIPAISAFLVFGKRKEIFGRPGPVYLPGLVIMAAGILLFFIGRTRPPGLSGLAAMATLAALLFALGSFVFLFGRGPLKVAWFPFAFLIFAIPLPPFVLDRIVSVLVEASKWVTVGLFRSIGVPFVQEGSVFHLPDLNLEVAQQCSGIRSSTALLITTVLAGHLFLKEFWRKAVLVLAVFPIAIIKNGLRIVSLYLLADLVDVKFLEGVFHHRIAGSVFFGLGLVFMGLVLWVLRKAGRQTRDHGAA